MAKYIEIIGGRQGVKHGQRVNLYRYDLKGNKNYFELAGGSSDGAFELTRVKLQ